LFSSSLYPSGPDTRRFDYDQSFLVQKLDCRGKRENGRNILTSTIELQVDKIGQLFETLDPMPFRERDLDRNAEEFIVSWARELPARAPIRILVHMPAAEAGPDHARMLQEAISGYFRYRAESTARSLSELFRIGRYSLLVGLVVLASCVTAGELIARVFAAPFGTLVKEGLIILGWVANWRPIEIFLYDWWPIVRHRNLFTRLATAEVEIVRR